MEGRQSKCNHCIHALLGCSHFQSCAFKSECENGTLALLQRFKGNIFHVRCQWLFFTSVSEKQRTNISTDRLGMARNESPKSAFWFGSRTHRLHGYQCHISTGFQYPTLLIRTYFPNTSSGYDAEHVHSTSLVDHSEACSEWNLSC